MSRGISPRLFGGHVSWVRTVEPQALDDPPAHQMFVDDFLDVLPVDVGVPYTLGIDDQHRPLFATIHAAGAVDADLPGARQTQSLDTRLGIIPQVLCPMALTAGTITLPLVRAEKHMITVIHDPPRF